MTMSTVLMCSVVRAIVIGIMALPASALIVRRLHATTNQRSSFGWWLAALLPLFVPDLLTGFSYRLTAARLIHSSAATECLYGGLLLFRIIALQVALQLVLPASAIGATSLHSWKLLPARDLHWWFGWLRLQISGPYRNLTVASIAGALLSLQDFETSALLQVDRHPIVFTVWLFDAHAAGETLSRSLSFIATYATIQLGLMAPALLLMTKVANQTSTAIRCTGRGTTFGQRCIATLIIAGSLIALVLWPVISNGVGLVSGLQALVVQNSLSDRVQQISGSLLVAAIAAACSLLIADRLNASLRITKLSLLLPGFMGSLVLSLCMLALFQSPVLNSFYDTWLPMMAASVLWLMPRSLLMIFLLNVTTSGATQHSAQLLAHGTTTQIQQCRRLRWKLVRQRWFLAWAILTHWSYWDVTIASILRPVRFEPVVIRLYNEMHYGRTESLVAITFLALLIPLIVFLVFAALLRFTPRLRQAVT